MTPAIATFMDPKLIEQKQLVERYLFGRLTPPEAKFFEQMVRRSPDLAERMGLPLALKRAMQLLDETGTEWQERPPRFWHRPWVPALLAALALLFAALTATFALGKHALAARYATLNEAVHAGFLNAPTRTQVVRIVPARSGETVQTYGIGARAEPTLVELRLVVSFIKDTLYRVTLTRNDGTFWGRLDNVLRDSNGELRLGISSGAFAAGTYDVAVEAVNLNGSGVLVGRLRLRVDP